MAQNLLHGMLTLPSSPKVRSGRTPPRPPARKEDLSLDLSTERVGEVHIEGIPQHAVLLGHITAEDVRVRKALSALTLRNGERAVTCIVKHGRRLGARAGRSHDRAKGIVRIEAAERPLDVRCVCLWRSRYKLELPGCSPARYVVVDPVPAVPAAVGVGRVVSPRLALVIVLRTARVRRGSQADDGARGVVGACGVGDVRPRGKVVERVLGCEGAEGGGAVVVEGIEVDLVTIERKTGLGHCRGSVGREGEGRENEPAARCEDDNAPALLGRAVVSRVEDCDARLIPDGAETLEDVHEIVSPDIAGVVLYTGHVLEDKDVWAEAINLGKGNSDLVVAEIVSEPLVIGMRMALADRQ